MELSEQLQAKIQQRVEEITSQEMNTAEVLDELAVMAGVASLMLSSLTVYEPTRVEEGIRYFTEGVPRMFHIASRRLATEMQETH